MLILFDIDLTLLRSHGVGVSSMQEACLRLFGRPVTFEGVEIAGRLDPLIWSDVARLNDLDGSDAAHARFREAYRDALARAAIVDGAISTLPGVPALLDALEEVDGLTLGLLTGNYPETGQIKLEAAGLDPNRFEIAAWGSDGRLRRDLPAVAMKRYAAKLGRAIEPHRVTVIGDTPYDVDCAKAGGCRALGVATGHTSVDQLEAAGADLVVEDLSDTASIVSWLLAALDAPVR